MPVMDPEEAAVERALTRLAVASTDAALEAVLRSLLPALLAALATKSEGAKKAIIDALQHINVRLRAASRVRLPTAALLAQAADPATPAVAKAFLLTGGYLRRAVAREQTAARAALLAPVLAAAASGCPPGAAAGAALAASGGCPPGDDAAAAAAAAGGPAAASVLAAHPDLEAVAAVLFPPPKPPASSAAAAALLAAAQAATGATTAPEVAVPLATRVVVADPMAPPPWEPALPAGPPPADGGAARSRATLLAIAADCVAAADGLPASAGGAGGREAERDARYVALLAPASGVGDVAMSMWVAYLGAALGGRLLTAVAPPPALLPAAVRFLEAYARHGGEGGAGGSDAAAGQATGAAAAAAAAAEVVSTAPSASSDAAAVAAPKEADAAATDGGGTPSWAAARVYPFLLHAAADGRPPVAEAAEAALRRLPAGGKTADAHPSWLPLLLVRAAASPGASVQLRAAVLGRALLRSTAAARVFPGAAIAAQAAIFNRATGPAAERLRGLGMQWVGWVATHATDADLAAHGDRLVEPLVEVLARGSLASPGLGAFAPMAVATLAARCPALVAGQPKTARVLLAAASDPTAAHDIRAAASRSLDVLAGAYAAAAPGVRAAVTAAGVDAYHGGAISPAGRAACVRWVVALGGPGVGPRWLAVLAAGDAAADVRAAGVAALRGGALPPFKELLDAAALGGAAAAESSGTTSAATTTGNGRSNGGGGGAEADASASPGGPRLTPESWAALLGFALRCWSAEAAGGGAAAAAADGGAAAPPPATARLLTYATTLLLPAAAPVYLYPSAAAVPPVPGAVTAAPALTVVLTLATRHPAAVATAFHPHLRVLTAAAAATPPPTATVVAGLARLVGVAVSAAPAAGVAATVVALTAELRAAVTAAGTGAAVAAGGGKVDAAVLCLGRVLAAVASRADGTDSVPREDAFAAIVEVLLGEGAGLAAAASAVGIVGEVGVLPMEAGEEGATAKPADGSPPPASDAKRLKTDGDAKKAATLAPPTRQSVVARLTALAADAKASARVVEAAASALGRLAVGDRAVAAAAVAALTTAAAARPEEEVALSVAEALARAATGLNLPPPPPAEEEGVAAPAAPAAGGATPADGGGGGGDKRADRAAATTAEEALAAVVAAPVAELVWVGGAEPAVAAKAAPADTAAAMDVDADADAGAGAPKPLIKTALDAMLGLCYNAKPHVRAAGVVGVHTALQLIGSPTTAPEYAVGDGRAAEALATAQAAVRDALPAAQRAFATLLADQNPVTQQLAARGVVLAHHLSDADAQQALVASLVKSLASDRSKASTASTVPGDQASLLPGVAGGAAAAGGSGGGAAAPSTYRDLCAVATDAGHPELLYKLMDVAGAAAMWNSRRGAALASRALLRSGAGDGGAAAQLAPHLPKLLPRVFLYAHDPAASVATSMKAVLGALAEAGGYPSEREALDAHLDAILGHALTAMGARLWRLREAACGAVRTLLAGRGWSAMAPHMELLWRMLWRAMDDVKETVRVAAGAYGRALAELSVRLCDARLSNTRTAGAAAGVILPALLPALTHSVAEVRQLAWKTLSTVLRTAGGGAAGAAALQPVVAAAAAALLEAATELEPAVLNYAQFHVEDGDSLEAARVSAAASSASDVIDALERLVPLVTDANAKDLVAVVVRSAKSGVGVPTRVATARFIRSLTAAAGGAAPVVAPSAGRLLRAASAAAGAERSASMVSAWAAAAGAAARIATDTAVGRWAGELAVAAVAEDAAVRARTASLARGLTAQAPDVAARHAAVLLPVAYVGSHADDATGGAAWRAVWADGCPSPAAGLRLYFAEIAAMASAQLTDSPSYDVKRAAAGALGGLASALVGRGGTEAVLADALRVLVAAMPGRLWEGKAAIVTAVADVCEALQGEQDPARDVTAATPAAGDKAGDKAGDTAAAAAAAPAPARSEKQREEAAWADAVWAAVPGGPAAVAAAVTKEARRGPAAYRAASTTALGRVAAAVRDRVALVEPAVAALAPLLAAPAAAPPSGAAAAAPSPSATDTDLADVQSARRTARAATVRALSVVAAAFPSAAAPGGWQARDLPTVVAVLAGGAAGEREVRLAAVGALAAVARRSAADVLAAAARGLLAGPPPAVGGGAPPPASAAEADAGGESSSSSAAAAAAAAAAAPTAPTPATASLGAALTAAVADARFATVRRAGLQVAVRLREVVPPPQLAAALEGVPAPGGGTALTLLRAAAAVDRDAEAKELGRRAVAGL